MAFEELDDLPHLVVEAGALRRIAPGVVEARLFAEARREDDAERRDAPKALGEAENDVVRRQLGDPRDLLGRVGRLAEERELQPDRADVGVALQARGHVTGGLAMGFARRE